MRKGMRKDNTAFTYALAAMTWLKVVPDKVLLRAATPAAWQRVRKEAQGALAPEHMACRLFGAAELAELDVRAIEKSGHMSRQLAGDVIACARSRINVHSVPVQTVRHPRKDVGFSCASVKFVQPMATDHQR